VSGGRGVQPHARVAHQFLDASDLWLVMTTGSRYADDRFRDALKTARGRS